MCIAGRGRPAMHIHGCVPPMFSVPEISGVAGGCAHGIRPGWAAAALDAGARYARERGRESRGFMIAVFFPRIPRKKYRDHGLQYPGRPWPEIVMPIRWLTG